MNVYYENHREQETKPLILSNHQIYFVPHFHVNVEIYLLEEGERQIVCNGKTYNMKSGSIAFFDSYDIHSYVRTETPCKRSRVLLVPYNLLTNFKNFRQKSKVAFPIIEDETLTKKLILLIDEVLAKTEDKNVITATVDMIFAFLEQKLEYAEGEQDEDVYLLKKILEFIYHNFKTDARLSTIAKNLGYTEEHLSREFHKFLKQSIPSYVNRLRLEYVEKELKKGEKKLSQIIYEAGFNNFQTYYRNKNKMAESKEKP